ncbi:MAG TPA: patatin-like phospholipase family protein [Steroidobacteraceae bacterium]|nr:patatin-like phospholipase family protein [Steroidobacteraceae bacterium]
MSPSASATAGARRPRICLVLSGGGARGLAHVGVLKVLEELRVPIDCIAGTSMGAIVGGLYASGMSAAQIEAAVRTVDWQESFRDRLPRRELAFRRKQDDRNFLVPLPIGLKHGRFLFPTGLIQGQKLQATLRRMTLRYDDTGSFDDLPTPFRAVATDLETGKTVILDRGDLALAMRASMSAPGVFAPVEEHGRLLVDGGLTDNLPVDVARAMGADVLIVVDVTFALQPRQRLTSALAISNQTLAILVRRNAEQQKATLGPRDVLIEPDLGGTGSADFSVAAQMIERGEQAARALRAKLGVYAVDAATYRRYVLRRAGKAPEPPLIQFVRVDARSKPYARTILATMQPLVGKPLDPEEVSARIAEIYGLGLFETVDYRLVKQGGGAAQGTGIEVRARRKSWGPNYVRFGLSLEDDFQGNSNYNAAVRFLVTEINDLGAEWLTDLQIGSNPKAVSEFYQPLSARRLWFVAPSARVEVQDLRVYSKDVEIADFRERQAEADLDIGRELGNWGEIRAGLHRINGDSRARFGNPNLVDRQFNNGELFFKFSYDRLDSVDFPREGQTSFLQWDAYRTDLGSDVAADRLTADWLMARSRGRNTLLLWTSAGTTLRGTLNPTSLQDFYSLGGFLNLSGLAARSLTGPNFAIGRAVYFRKIGHGGEGLFEFPAYLGMSFEAGNVWDRRGQISYGSARKDISLFLGLDTFLGPLYLGGGYDSAGYSAYYLFLGRTF